MAPPVPGHPLVKLGDLHGGAGKHDEVGHAGGGPVVEVIEGEGVADLVQENVDVLVVHGLEEVLGADALAPVAASTALHALGEPERHVCGVLAHLVTM